MLVVILVDDVATKTKYTSFWVGCELVVDTYFQKIIVGFLHASLYVLHFFIACGSMCGNWQIPQRVSDKDTFKKEKEKDY
jgi:hypothetical protein